MPDPAMHEITVMTKTVMLDAKIGSAYTKGKDCVLTFDWQASEVRAYLASGDASGAPLLSIQQSDRKSHLTILCSELSPGMTLFSPCPVT